MFDLRKFVKEGLLSAIGKMADYKIRLNAVGWLEKGLLEEEDLQEIDVAINALQTLTIDSAENNNEPLL